MPSMRLLDESPDGCVGPAGGFTTYHNVIHPDAVHGPKERWLHTRISETLEDALKREARRRRQPVSLLVRDVLEGALDLVEDIVETSLGAGPRSRTRRHGRALDDVYGWQELILNRGADCARCDADLSVGEAAYRGLTDEPGPPAILCRTCIRRLREPDNHQKEQPS